MNTIIDGVDYGPLAQLLGKWVGNKGLDIAPDNKAQEDRSAFTDEMTFTISGPAENAEEQQLVSVKYHHVIRRSENGAIFHDQIGHWIYEPSTGVIMHSLSIPRGVCLLAGGKFEQHDDSSIFLVNARSGDDDFGISQSPFMMNKAKTTAFEMKLTVQGNQLNYREVISLHIYGNDFEHVDQSSLQRVLYDFD